MRGLRRVAALGMSLTLTAACGAFGAAAPEAAPADGGAGDGSSSGDATPAPDEAGAVDGAAALGCEGGVFDDFERAPPIAPAAMWTDSYASSGASLLLVPGEGFQTSTALRASLASGGNVQAFARQSKTSTAADFAACVALRFRADALPNDYVEVLRWLMYDGSDSAKFQGLQIELEKDGTVNLLQSNNGSCPQGATCAKGSLPLGSVTPGAFHTLVVDLTAAPFDATTSTFGSARVALDGSAIASDLTVGLGAHDHAELRVGATGTAPASITVDDVRVRD